MTWSTFDKEFTSTSVYAGDDLTLTCRGEPDATLQVYNYGYQALTTEATTADVSIIKLLEDARYNVAV